MPRSIAFAESAHDRFVPSRRQIGPLGTGARLIGGAAAVTLPIALGGFGWWDALGALVLLPLIATLASAAITAASGETRPSPFAARPAICSGTACLLIGVMVAADAGLAALTPIEGDVAIWVWLGVSMLLAAGAGYGGCEVLAIPNLLMRRNDQIGCMLYTPIDRWEASRKSPARSGAAHAQRL